MRLIDADVLYEKTAEWEAQALHMADVTMHDEDKTEWRRWSAVLTERSAFKHDIADAPTIDAVEVVRCKDCKHWYSDADTGMACEFTNIGQPEDGFCNWAERRSDD